MRFTALAAPCAVLFAQFSAQPVMAEMPRPGGEPSVNEMVEVGAEVHSDDEVRFVISAGTAGVPLHEIFDLGTGWDTYVARVRARAGVPDFAFDGFPAGGDLAYYEIEFVPLVQEKGVYPGEGPGKTYRMEPRDYLLPTTVARDPRLEQEFALDVRVASRRLKAVFPRSKELYFLMDLTVEAIGYRLRRYFEEESEFHGVSPLGAEAELGYAYEAGRSAVVTAVIGGAADVAVGKNDGFSIASDLALYGEARLDLFKLTRIFLRAGVRGSGDIDHGMDGLAEVLAGLRFYY